MAILQEFAENVWIVDGPPVRFLGMLFPTRMILVKLSDGSLWVNSPVSTEPEILSRLSELGPVHYLVAPNRLHVWRLEEWHIRFPDAELWLPSRIPRAFKNLPAAGFLGDISPPSWEKDLDQLVFRGNLFLEEVFFLHKPSRTVILADLIQNHPLHKRQPLINLIKRLGGVASFPGGVPRDIRLSFVNRGKARQSLEELLSWDFDKLIIGHGTCLDKDAKPFMKQAFHWLLE